MSRRDAGESSDNRRAGTATAARPVRRRAAPPAPQQQTVPAPPPGYALVPIGPHDAPEGGGIVAPTSLSGGPYLLSDGRVFLMPPATNALKNSGYWPGGSGNGQQPYPDMPKVSDRKPLLEMMGATGTAIPSGIITSEEYNEDFTWKDGIKIYEAMSRSEGQAAAIYQILELPIRRATWSIEPFSDDPADKEIASFIQTALLTTEIKRKTTTGRTLTQKWDDVLRHALMMLRFGFMAFEQCWRVEDGWVKWAHFLPLLPRTIWRWWTGPDNELEGIQQYTWKGYAYRLLDIPADKLLLFIHRQEGQNFEGVSLYRSAYQHWWYKQQFYKIQAIDIERNSVPVPVITLPEGFSEADFQAAESILANLRVNESMGVTLPPGWTLDYANSHGKQATQIQPAIDHHDVMMARAVLAQFINLGSTETGAFALDASQKATLLAALQAECEYIEDVFNTDAIPRLVDYNFAGVEGYPKLKCAKVLAQDFDAIANALNKLVNITSGQPLIHPDLELEDFLRNELGLPKAPKSVIEGYNPTSPDTASQPTATPSGKGSAGSSQDESGTAENTGEGKGGEGQTADGGSSDLPDQGGPDADGGGGGALSEQRSEARLLREALAEARQWDAVDRGMTFYNPNHDAKGRFGTGGGGGEHESESESGGGKGKAGGGAKGKGAAKGTAGPKGRAATQAAKQAAKGAKAEGKGEKPAQGSAKAKGGAKAPRPTAEERAAAKEAAKQAKAEELRARLSHVAQAHNTNEMQARLRGLPAAQQAKAAKAWLDAHTKVEVNADHIKVTNHSGQVAIIRADTKFGGYKMEVAGNEYRGHMFEGRIIGNRLADHNAYLHGFTGKAGLLKEGMIEPGAKPNAAQLKVLKAEAARNQAARDRADRLRWGGRNALRTNMLPERTRQLPGAPHTRPGVLPMHRGEPDLPRIPEPASRTDEHGQQLPFSHKQFDAARGKAEKFDNGNITETTTAKIAGRQYVIKMVEESGYHAGRSFYEEQRNEAATVAGMKALGMGDLAPTEAYHVVGSDGRRYAVLSVEKGTGENFGKEHGIANKVSEESLRKAVLGSYLLGMEDRHAGNFLYDARSGSVRLIDFGFSLKGGIRTESRDALREVWAMKLAGRNGGRVDHRDQMIWPHAELGGILGRESAVRDALSHFDLSAAESKAVTDRFAAVRRLYGSGKDVSYQALANEVGQS